MSQLPKPEIEDVLVLSFSDDDDNDGDGDGDGENEDEVSISMLLKRKREESSSDNPVNPPPSPSKTAKIDATDESAPVSFVAGLFNDDEVSEEEVVSALPPERTIDLWLREHELVEMNCHGVFLARPKTSYRVENFKKKLDALTKVEDKSPEDQQEEEKLQRIWDVYERIWFDRFGVKLTNSTSNFGGFFDLEVEVDGDDEGDDDDEKPRTALPKGQRTIFEAFSGRPATAAGFSTVVPKRDEYDLDDNFAVADDVIEYMDDNDNNNNADDDELSVEEMTDDQIEKLAKRKHHELSKAQKRIDRLNRQLKKQKMLISAIEKKLEVCAIVIKRRSSN